MVSVQLLNSNVLSVCLSVCLSLSIPLCSWCMWINTYIISELVLPRFNSWNDIEAVRRQRWFHLNRCYMWNKLFRNIFCSVLFHMYPRTCEMKRWNNVQIISVLYFTCIHVWNWNKFFSAAEGVLKLYRNYFSDIEDVGKYLWAAIILWNNFRQASTLWDKIMSDRCRQAEIILK